MNKIKIQECLTRKEIESVSILLASICEFKAYDIRNAILQLNSIDDVIIIAFEAKKFNISLDEAVYLRLKGRDEK